MSAIPDDRVVVLAERLRSDIDHYLHAAKNPVQRPDAIRQLRRILEGKASARMERYGRWSREVVQRQHGQVMTEAYEDLLPVVQRVRSRFLAYWDIGNLAVLEGEVGATKRKFWSPSDALAKEILAAKARPLSKAEIAEILAEVPEAAEMEEVMKMKWTYNELRRLCSMRASDWVDELIGVRAGKGSRTVRGMRAKTAKHRGAKK
jgi:hypothetical protein